MRKNPTLGALFPKTRGELLEVTLAQPEKWWFLSELAKSLKTRPSSLQRELARLVHADILERRLEGRRTYFRAQQHSPIYRDLQRIFDKTSGVVPTLQSLLIPFAENIDFAFVYGSIARGEEHSASDVDLMIVGSTGLSELAPSLRAAERKLMREVNAMVYSPVEFRKKLRHKDHFLSAVLRKPKQFVKGSASELASIVGQ